jgi:AraC-like DNA-binding protein
VHGWHAQRDGRTDRIVHRTRPGFGHALLSPIVTHIFRSLRVSASLWEHGNEWFTLHTEPNVSSFEYRYEVGEQRFAYNGRLWTDVLRRKKAVLGTHAGYSDLFAPVIARGQVAAILVTGPFALSRPTGVDVLERWRWITGRPGHTSDPELASYLAATLRALVLHKESLAAFERIVSCLALLLAGECSAESVINESEALRVELDRVRLPERMWEAVGEMVDERSSSTWYTGAAAADIARLGLSRIPDTVLVGLTVSGKEADPIDEAVRRNAFQRASVEIARALGDTVVGCVGDHGVVFLSATTGSAEKRRKKLRAMANHASLLARRDHGLRLHWGTGPAEGSMPLSGSYHAALAAAESALAQGSAIVAAGGPPRPRDSLLRLRQDLGRAVEERPDQLGARFDRYVESVVAQCGHSLEASRRKLDAGLEWMAGLLVRSGTLEEKSFVALSESLERDADDARTLAELSSAYGRAARDLSEAVRRPVAARHERSFRHALRYIEQHFAEAIGLGAAARAAGMAPDYFRKLFRTREGTTFQRYVLRLRIERAKQLLTNTGLGIGRVAEMCGFASAQYFCRAFRAATGKTPGAYRSVPEAPSVRS